MAENRPPGKRTLRTIMIPKEGTPVSGLVLTWSGGFVTGERIGELCLHDGDTLVLQFKVPELKPKGAPPEG
jgi:hypothetical protein